MTETFLSILKAAGEDPGHSLNLLVTDVGYRETFLKLTRNLAPTGKLFHQMDIRGIGDRSPVVLLPESRRLISDTLRTARAKTIGEASDQESTYFRVYCAHWIWIKIGLRFQVLEFRLGSKVYAKPLTI